MIKLNRFIFNPFDENTYLIWEEKSKETIVIDPGCSDSVEEKELKDFISQNKLKPKYLLNTHCHIDHILGNAFVKSEYIVEFIAGEEDVFLLDLMQQQANMFGLEVKNSPKPDKYITEGFKLDFQGIKIQFLFTPGHTPGEYCIYFPDDNFCITGDVLFKEAIGRTDLWKGDYDTLIASIQNKLLLLPDNVIIYPGHGDESTIGYEKKNNPFL